jgi:chromate transporter
VLSGALAAITAAVVGVVANLAVWFGGHVLAPTASWTSSHWQWGLVVWIGLTRWKWNVVPVVIGAGVAGLLYQTLR